MTTTLGHVGRYELLSRLGAGGMGEVFLARTTGTQGFETRVVIKRMLPHLAGDPDFVRRFVDEGKLVVQLRHPGIAQVLDMGEDQGITYIAMEYVDGRDLAELVRLARTADIALPPGLVVTILNKVLEALDYAHHAKDTAGRPMGIIHRDVSPSNVMISTSGSVKLLDFGIAKATERLSTSTSGAIRGKYNYMSPQQAQGATLDARSDLFSVGVMAWELLSGVRPFDASSDLQTLDRIRFHDPGSLRAVAPDIPEDLGTIIDQLLAKQPEDRFPSADAAHRAFQAYLYRTQEVVSSRDLAAWVESVLHTLPKALRDLPGAGLSLDDALRLGLGSEPRRPLGPQTAAASPLAGVADTLPATPSGQASTVPPPGLGPLPQPVTTAHGGPPARRGPAMLLLVALNMLLLGAVTWLVVRSVDGDPAVPAGETRLALAPDAVVGPDVALTPSPDADRDSLAPSLADGGADAGRHDVVDTQAGAAGPFGVTFGGAFGPALDGLIDDARWATLTLTAAPATATIRVAGWGWGRGRVRATVARGEPVTVTVSADKHAAQTRTFTVTKAADTRRVELTPEVKETGRIELRVRPAGGTVYVDGRPTGRQNDRGLVTSKLPVGRYQLTVKWPDGRSWGPKTIQVRADEAHRANIDLPPGDP